MPTSEMTLGRAEALAERLLPTRTPKKRMLVIVNPYATTVSDRLRNLVVHALESRYLVQAVNTENPRHATQICREAADFRPRRADLGRVDGRFFTFSSGIGLDASVVKRVDAHPRLKTRLGKWYYTYAAVSTFNRRYLVRAPHVSVEAGGRRVDGVTVVVQNSDPYTYFGAHPIRICEGTGLDTGTLGLTVLRRATPLEFPTLLWRAFSGRAETVARHRQIEAFNDVSEARIERVDERPFPVHVDGDFIGYFEQVRYGVEPRALAVVS